MRHEEHTDDSHIARLLALQGAQDESGMTLAAETSASATGYSHRISMSHTAMMWHTLPASTKKWNTVCMNRRLRRQ